MLSPDGLDRHIGHQSKLRQRIHSGRSGQYPSHPQGCIRWISIGNQCVYVQFASGYSSTRSDNGYNTLVIARWHTPRTAHAQVASRRLSKRIDDAPLGRFVDVQADRAFSADQRAFCLQMGRVIVEISERRHAAPNHLVRPDCILPLIENV